MPTGLKTSDIVTLSTGDTCPSAQAMLAAPPTPATLVDVAIPYTVVSASVAAMFPP